MATFYNRCNLLTLWNLWWIGDKNRKIPPYRFLRSFDVPKQKGMLSKAGAVINCILEFAGLTSTQVGQMSFRRRSEVFEESFQTMCKCIFCPDCSSADEMERLKLGTLSFVTIYEKLCDFSNEVGIDLPSYLPGTR